jgi:hypothetical protein
LVLILLIDVEFCGEDDVTTQFGIVSKLMEDLIIPAIVVDHCRANNKVIFFIVNCIHFAFFISNVHFFDAFVAFLLLGDFKHVFAQFHAMDLLESFSLEVMACITLTTSDI